MTRTKGVPKKIVLLFFYVFIPLLLISITVYVLGANKFNPKVGASGSRSDKVYSICKLFCQGRGSNSSSCIRDCVNKNTVPQSTATPVSTTKATSVSLIIGTPVSNSESIFYGGNCVEVISPSGLSNCSTANSDPSNQTQCKKDNGSIYWCCTNSRTLVNGVCMYIR